MSATLASARTLAGVPGVRAWRKRVRRARREHHDRSIGDVLTDLYTLLWFFLIYGTALISEIRRHLGSPAAMEGAVERHWLGVAALLTGAGLAWRALRALGPMLATPAEQTWALSSPLDRRGWLLPRFAAVVLTGAAVGALVTAGVTLLGVRDGGIGKGALIGAVYGATLPAASVAAQRSGRHRRLATPVGIVLLVAGGLLALAVVAAHYAGSMLPSPIGGSGLALLTIGTLLCVVAVRSAVGALPRLDRATLGEGSRLAAAVVTSAVWLDPTVLSGVLEVRKWRRVGRVRSRRMRGGVPGLTDRVWGLLQAEVVRATRRPGALAVFAGLALAQYGVAVVAPSLAGVARVILAYVAAGRLMAGLRALAGSSALRRALGGGELMLRASHVVVPALALAVWWLATEPAAPGSRGAAGLVLAAGVVAAAYRAATRGAMKHGGTVIETPLGLLPLDLILQLSRGPDLLGVVILLEVLL